MHISYLEHYTRNISKFIDILMEVGYTIMLYIFNKDKSTYGHVYGKIISPV